MKATRNTLLAASAMLLLAACDGTPHAAVPRSATQIKLATWNLEHLAEADGSGCRPRSAADYAALRRYADRLDADVIAIEEVENARAAERVFSPDKYVVVMSARPESQRHGPCHAEQPDGPAIRKQDVGFAIRKGLHFTRHPDLSELALGNPDLRWGVDITVDYAAQQIRLLAVHLKSGCFDSDAAAACPVLLDPVPILQRWVAARAAQGGAFAIIGDWNRHLDVADDRIWRDLHESTPTAALVDATAQHQPTCDARYSEFIDHLVMNQLAAARQVPNSFEEFTYDGPATPHPSDHCPLALILR